jgi:hypothetical protein
MTTDKNGRAKIPTFSGDRLRRSFVGEPWGERSTEKLHIFDVGMGDSGGPVVI